MHDGGATSSEDSGILQAEGAERPAGSEGGGASSSSPAAAEGRTAASRAGPRRRSARAGRPGRPGPNGEAVPVAVTWCERQRRPVAFVWRGRRYAVERVLETWVIETGWWKDGGGVSRSYWRVRAGGRVVDLRFDRASKSWALDRVLS